MKKIISKTKREWACQVAELIAIAVKKKPNLVLGLATGRTAIPLYENLVLLYKNKKIDFAEVKTFNLDEYMGLSPQDKKSFRYFMEKNLFSKINIKKENINFLNGKAKNAVAECKRYESKIKKAGGIDLQILGIGLNGHIGFNEPGSSFKSRTRKVKLSASTKRANKISNQYALTMGLATIFSARKILLLAKGRKKAEIIKKLIKEKPNKNLPATILKKHKDVVILLDKKAASKIK